ncbi:MAG: ZIP family metal transporter [DPANN group archaeon]|nr:ZIP family metal transporter [DPANN group archaeon]
MAATLAYTLTSVLIVSLVSLIGVIYLSVNEKTVKRILFYMVSFAAGALLGAAFLDLMPEAGGGAAYAYVLAGLVVFFLIENFLHWHHIHHEKKEAHSFAYMNLLGDGVHNLIDGAIIAGAYIASVPLGIVTTIAVVLHEIPQEIGDFGVLLYGGFSKTRALTFNFLTALTAFIGAGLAYYFSTAVQNFNSYLIPFAAGGFIYIATVDLLPALRRETEKDFRKSVAQTVFVILGIAMIWGAGKLIV